ncbi:MAG: PAC2 family protein [Candidatus Promineifilaceae bacterium]|jgi:proteasome assembly chaperone (PAC2) family protein
MDNTIHFEEIPHAKNMRMITGWRQWADAGSVSSALPEYLVELVGARKIGEMSNDGFYIFQIPGTHHLMRPVIKLEEGYRRSLEENRNEFYFAGDEENGLVIFIGDEPHMGVDAYARNFFSAAKVLGVSQIAGLAGVYGPVPYNLDRQISCIYSLPSLKAQLEDYAVDFSDYEGGASIGSILASKAEAESMPYIVFYAFTPAYDFSEEDMTTQGIRLENDYKAWLDIMRRLNHLLDLNLDLSDLEERSRELIDVIDSRIIELEEEMPHLGIREYLQSIEEQFTETPFFMLDDVWEDEFRNLFGDGDEV